MVCSLMTEISTSGTLTIVVSVHIFLYFFITRSNNKIKSVFFCSHEKLIDLTQKKRLQQFHLVVSIYLSNILIMFNFTLVGLL